MTGASSGRGDELRALDRVLNRAAAGTLALAVVEGEAGIGKSWLFEQVRRRAEKRGFGVHTGGCHELEDDRPFGPLADALRLGAATTDPDHMALTRLLAGSDVADPSPLVAHAPGQHFQILEALLAYIEELANARPTVVVLEDLHWADPSTLLALDHLCRRLSHHPLALLCSFRPSPHRSDLDRLLERARPGVHLRLAGLDPEVVADLVEDLTGAPAGHELLALIQGAGGNPLFLIELVTALQDEHAISATGELRRGMSHRLPPSFRLTTLRRLSFLPDATLDVLRTAAVLGDAFGVDDLAVVLDQSGGEVVVALRQPLEARLVGEDGDRLAFRHALVRDAIYADLPVSARRALHLQVARRLGAAGRPVIDVARHFRLGADRGDREAAQWLQRAGKDAASRAPEVAAELLRAALAIAPAGDDERDVLEAELGVAEVWSGDLESGTARLQALLDRPHWREVHVPACFSLARALLLQSKTQRSIELLARATDDAALPAGDRPRFLAERCLAHLVGGEIQEAGDLARQALQEGEEHGDEASICLAMSVQAVVMGLGGHVRPGIELARQTVDRATASPDREASRIPPQLWLAGLLLDADDLDEARRLLEVARGISEAFGTVWDQPVFHLLSATAHFHAGDFDDALAEVDVALTLGAEVGTRVNVVWAHAILGHICLQRSDLAGAERSVADGEAAMVETGPQVRGTHWLLWARALLFEADDNAAAALAVLRLLWDGLEAVGVYSEHTLLGPDLVRLTVGADDRDAAREIAEAVERAAALNASPAALGAAQRCQGLATGDPDLLLSAVETYAASSRRATEGQAAEDAGVALAASGRKNEAERCLRDALAIYRPRRMRRAERRTEAALRGIGVRTGQRGSRNRPDHGWEALTGSEEEATRLAAQGLTNPEIGTRMFISRRTVESHLGHVFAKLGISSRVELAALVAGGDHEDAQSSSAGGPSSSTSDSALKSSTHPTNRR